MVSETNDVCTWCRRPFNQYFDLRVVTNPTPVKKRWKPSKLVQGSVLLALIILAIFSIASWKTGPDAAKIAQTASANAPKLNTSGASGSKLSTAPPNASSAPDSALSAGASGSGVQASNGTSVQNSGSSAKPPVATEGLARLQSIHLNTQDDSEGNETAYGTLVIVNSSENEISDFTLTLKINKNVVQLIPYQGDISYPMSMTTKHIPPHGKLQVQVMSAAKYPNVPLASKSVLLQATFDGLNGLSADSAPVQ